MPDGDGGGAAGDPFGRRDGRGPFVVLEGADAVGKSTQAELLAEWLDQRGVPYRSGREPGGTPLGEAIRTLVLQREDLAPSPEAELFLILAARTAFVREEVQPVLEAGSLYLADRFDLSSLAYQGGGHGLELERVRYMNEVAVRGCRPDVYVVLDVPGDEGEARQARAGTNLDRMESQGADFLDRVRATYRDLAAAEPNAELVDGRGDPREVHRRILSVLARRIGGVFAGGSGEPLPRETG